MKDRITLVNHNDLCLCGHNRSYHYAEDPMRGACDYDECYCQAFRHAEPAPESEQTFDPSQPGPIGHTYDSGGKTPEQMRVELEEQVAFAMEWKREWVTVETRIERHGMVLPNYFGPACWAWWHKGTKGIYSCPPKLTLDLMALAEATLTDEEWNCYIVALENLLANELSRKHLWSRGLISATALQRAKAFLAVMEGASK